MLRITAANSAASEGDYLVVDNIRVLTGSFDTADRYSTGFDNDMLNAAPAQAKIRTGSYYSRGPKLTVDETTTIQPALIIYGWQVCADPTNSENRALRGIRGSGSNVSNYNATTRVVIKKPNDKLNISFKVLLSAFNEGQWTSKSQIFGAYAVDGDYDGFISDSASVPDGSAFAQLFAWTSTTGTVTGPSKQWSGNAITDVNTWIPVDITYDVRTGEYTTYINGELLTAQPKTDSLADVMSTSNDCITVLFKHFNAELDKYIMLDDISVVGTSTEPSLGLFSDADCTLPATELAGTVYAKLDGEPAMVIIAAYNGEKLVTAITASGTTASLTIPEGCTAVKAFAWNADTLKPVTAPATIQK